MSAASDYLENEVLDHVLGETARNFTSPSALYLALFTGTAADVKGRLEAGTLTDEVTTSSSAYDRKAINVDSSSGAFDVASSGSTSNTQTITFDTATANWGSITCVAVMDGATAGAGNVLFYGEVTTAKTIETGDTFQVSAGNLTISLA
jgi:hypothetical protein